MGGDSKYGFLYFLVFLMWYESEILLKFALLLATKNSLNEKCSRTTGGEADSGRMGMFCGAVLRLCVWVQWLCSKFSFMDYSLLVSKPLSSLQIKLVLLHQLSRNLYTSFYTTSTLPLYILPLYTASFPSTLP